ncbi:MAG: phosphatase PAP2 family protein [Clostridia bacterium]|nr:phosphatase PAP2 family protein [Clostridia bacterium]
MSKRNNFNHKKITEPQNRHLLLLLYWIAYAVMYISFELFGNRNFHTISCPLDYKIPFCEFFFIPYFFWYVFLFGTVLYTLFFDIPNFKKIMYFIIISFTAAFFIYLIYPSVQNLRPNEFLRDNFFTDAVKALYTVDTNTNVCPSIHVIGSMGVCFTLWNTKGFSSVIFRVLNVIITVLICLSTVFLKQHSVVDLVLGVLISIIVYPISLLIFKKQSVKR